MSDKKYTLQSIMNMTVDEFNKLSTADLREVTNIVNRNARQRSKRLKEANLEYSPAYRQYNQSKRAKKLQAAGKSVFSSGVTKTTKFARQKMMKSLSQGMTFLKDKTSTVKGMTSANRETQSRLGVSMTDYQLKQYWKAYREAMGKIGNISKALGMDSEGMQKELAKYKTENKKKSRAKIAQHLIDQVNAEYEQRMSQSFEQKSQEGDFGYDIGGEEEE